MHYSLSKCKKSILIITVSLCVVTFILFILNMNNVDKIVIRSAVRIELINDIGEISGEIYTSEEKTVLCTFGVASQSNQDIVYDVILLSNFKQKEFSINNSDFKEVHKIIIPKSQNVITTKMLVSFNIDNTKINDCFLILTPKQNKNIRLSVSEYHIIKRFSVVNLNAEADIQNYGGKKSIISDITVGDKIMAVLEHEDTKQLSESDIRKIYKGVTFDKPFRKPLNIPIFYRVKERLKESVQIDRNTHINALIFAIENNKIVSIFNGNAYEEFCISINKSNIISTQIDFQEDAKEITFYIVNYPFTKQSDFDDYNNVMLWDNVFYTEKIAIKNK